MSEPILELQDITCHYGAGSSRVDVFEHLNLKIHAGETVALLGPSGCGKSSLLHIAGLLEKPSAGAISILGRSVAGLSDRAISQLRMKEIGFVFQFHHLLPEFDALDNVALPALIAGERKARAREKAAHLLAEIGLAARTHHRPREMSGGERQRVAIARALINQPRLLIADEPTGNLDPATAKLVFSSLLNLLKSDGADSKSAIIVATHNIKLAQMMQRVLGLAEGHLTEGVLQESKKPAKIVENEFLGGKKIGRKFK